MSRDSIRQFGIGLIWQNSEFFLSVCIDNNLAEQAMRPIALGRKNYLFVGSETAGRHAAMLYSLVETCKVNRINPLSYLTMVLEQLPQLSRHPSQEALMALRPYTDANLQRHRLV